MLSNCIVKYSDGYMIMYKQNQEQLIYITHKLLSFSKVDWENASLSLIAHIFFLAMLLLWSVQNCINELCPGGWFNIKMPSYQYRKSHCGDKTILRPSYLHNGISYTGKITSLYWIRVQASRLRTLPSGPSSPLQYQVTKIKGWPEHKTWRNQ